MSTPFDAGQKHAQQNKPLPPQGNTSAETYKQFTAGWNSNKK
jgi:hypothetical protein